MARNALLKRRIANLEAKNVAKHAGTNRVLYYRADTDAPTGSDLHVWQAGGHRDPENPASGPLRAFVGMFMLVADYEDWERAAREQQQRLIERVSQTIRGADES